MRDRIDSFLTALDRALQPEAAGETLALYHIGRSSLVWRYEFPVTTFDVDVICPGGGGRLLRLAVTLAGRGTKLAGDHGLYLEQVPEGLPPVPGGFQQRATAADGPWAVLQLFHLDPNDLAATKLRRFSTRDREDVLELCDRLLVTAERLTASLESAFRYTMEKDGDPDRDKAFRNLKTVVDYLSGRSAGF